MIDIHTHVLPNMDDGSDSVDTSNELLRILQEQNVKLVCLTSHFYPSDESIDEFIKRRNKAYKSLNYKGDLDIRLGSEVHYYRGIVNSEDIGKLCIENSKVLLLELPFFHSINESIVNEIIGLNYKYNVVLAHIERYDIKMNLLKYLKENDVLFQVNADSFKSKAILKLFEKGYIDFIGSDAHNLSERSPHYDEAISIIKNKYGEDILKKFIEKSYKILSI